MGWGVLIDVELFPPNWPDLDVLILESTNTTPAQGSGKDGNGPAGDPSRALHVHDTELEQ